ncbi:antibiotic biosynthesis monooxygenase [Pukyongia salina]|uniref:Antibiotic biosynthesis monooxygenase n=1 Tax=Pukyongia salina TaxID=2094025 RepID=A0A2S0HV61_9FLAO|nr:antibiotic biosynthesis monooxygenase [Pukyongia salina]AVI50520.1 antibiotic biosynthesis monooxygenase [Pukyongia salina]
MKPYYAVIFTSLLSNNTEGYQEMAIKMETLAKKQPGYLGFESAREDLGITISYWESLEDIKNWKQNLEHLEAQHLGRNQWYRWYRTRICRVEREYEFEP